MSQVKTSKFKCPECGKEQDIDIHLSINMMFGRELVKDLIDGKLTTVKCDCGEIYHLRCPLLVNTMGSPCLFIQFNESADEDRKAQELINKVTQDDNFGNGLFKMLGVEEPKRELYTSWEEFISRLKEVMNV